MSESHQGPATERSTALESCDPRPWLQLHPDAVDRYTATRIHASYERMDSVFAPCAGLQTRRALDVGCGAGHESFALAARFEAVLGFDTNPAAIRTARRIAAGAGCTRVTFEVRSTEDFRPPQPYDLVWCNLMSHGASSRLALLETLRTCLTDGGWLMYAEVTEGWAPMEVHRAIMSRHAAAARLRLRQWLDGLTGNPSFRFFLSGSAASVLQQLGLAVVETQTSTWNALTYGERLWARVEGAAGNTAERREQDYLQLDPDFAQVRHLAQRYVRGHRVRLSATDRADIRREAAAAQNRFAPLLMGLLLAEGGLAGMHGTRWAEGRVGRLLPPPDWSRLEALDAEFMGILAHRLGVDVGSLEE